MNPRLSNELYHLLCSSICLPYGIWHECLCLHYVACINCYHVSSHKLISIQIGRPALAELFYTDNSCTDGHCRLSARYPADVIIFIPLLVAWHSGRTSVFGRRTFGSQWVKRNHYVILLCDSWLTVCQWVVVWCWLALQYRMTCRSCLHCQTSVILVFWVCTRDVLLLQLFTIIAHLLYKIIVIFYRVISCKILGSVLGCFWVIF